MTVLHRLQPGVHHETLMFKCFETFSFLKGFSASNLFLFSSKYLMCIFYLRPLYLHITKIVLEKNQTFKLMLTFKGVMLVQVIISMEDANFIKIRKTALPPVWKRYCRLVMHYQYFIINLYSIIAERSLQVRSSLSWDLQSPGWNFVHGRNEKVPRGED